MVMGGAVHTQITLFEVTQTHTYTAAENAAMFINNDHTSITILTITNQLPTKHMREDTNRTQEICTIDKTAKLSH